LKSGKRVDTYWLNNGIRLYQFYTILIREEIPMKKTFKAIVGLALLVSVLFFGRQVSPAAADSQNILEFQSMVGTPSAFTGTQAPIRGINGGGLPWKLTSAQGELKSDGSLEVQVRGLVLAAGLNNGSNPIANFKAVVSCLAGDASVVNVSSGLFPATTGPASSGGGNSKIETTLSLPQPCIAPIVFVTSPSGTWFAVTGK
jgi:hypothetical protein